MKLRLFLVSTACLYFMAPATGVNLLAAAAATKGVVIGGLTGSGSVHPVVIETKPPQHVIVEHKPVTLVPVATIPSYSIMDKLTNLWGGISDSITTKIRAVGDFFRGPPKVVFINVDKTTTHKPTTTKKPTTHQPPLILEIIAGVPQHRVYPMQVPVLVDDCGNTIKCTY